MLRRHRGNEPDEDSPLVGNLQQLRDGPPVTVEQVNRMSALAKVCDPERRVDATAIDRFRSAIAEMADAPIGRALAATYGLGTAPEQSLEERRKIFERRDGLADGAAANLEEKGVRELALRLLGGYYVGAPGGQQVMPNGPWLTRDLKAVAVYRNCRLVFVRQERRVIATGAGNEPFLYEVKAGVRLIDVLGAKIHAVQQEEKKSVYILRFNVNANRGDTLELAFTSVVPSSAKMRSPRKNDSYNFDLRAPVLNYRPTVEFYGEYPKRNRLKVFESESGKGRSLGAAFQGQSRSKLVSNETNLSCLKPSEGLIIGWAWKRPSILLLFTAALLALVAAADIPRLLALSDEFAGNLTIVGRLLILVVSVGLVYRYCWQRNRQSFRYSHEYNLLRQLHKRTALSLQAGAEDTPITYQQANILAAGVTRARLLRARLVESYEPARRTVRQHVSIDIKVPLQYLRPSVDEGDGALSEADDTTDGAEVIDAGQTILFPILVPTKAKFQDEFSVYGQDGAPLHVLPYREYLQVASVALRTLLVTAAGGKTPKQVGWDFVKAERQALELIMVRRDGDGSAPGIDLNTQWHLGVPVVETEQARLARQWAIDLVQMLSSHYAIIVPVKVDADGRALVKFEQTLIPDLEVSGKGRLAVVVGARPVDLSFGIRNASTCRSYHLRVGGPEMEGLYLGDQSLEDAGVTLTRQAQGEGVPPHFRFRRRLGQPYAHLYMRFFPEPARVGSLDQGDRFERPAVRFKFFETPPGSLLRAALSAVACAVLVWVVGIVNSHAADPGTDAPAFILAFPALIGAWLGFESTSRRLLEGTISARLSLFLTVAASISATGLFMGHKAFNGVLWWHQLPFHWSLLWVSDWSWLVLLIVSLTNASAISYLYIRRVAYYIYLSTRNQGEDIKSHG